MSEAALSQSRVDKPVVLIALFLILALSLFLQQAFDLRHALLFLTGIGLGISLMHAMFGFTGGWRSFIRSRRSAGVRSHIILLMLSSLLFFPVVGGAFNEVNSHPALAPVGVSVLVGAFLFGIGMQLGGGCGSGTLYTVGQGQTDMLITITFFVVGATLGSYHLPWWLQQPNIGKISVISELGGWLPALLLQLAVLAVLYIIVRRMELKRRNSVQDFKPRHPQQNLLDQFIFGPWPLWWGAIGLTVFGLATLLLAGYPWSITYAYGLWGAKILSSLGVDISSWTYWSAGYPAKSLNSSVLADITSIMDFGIIIGAMLAAALASKFAPPGKIIPKRVVTAVVGGLLLGYGARLAFGCNIGGMLGGIASGSLHGWLWLLAAFPGGILGTYIRVWMKFDKPFGAKA